MSFFSSPAGPSEPHAGAGIVSKILPRLRRPGVQSPGSIFFVCGNLCFFTTRWSRCVLFFLPGGPFGAARQHRHSFKNLTAPQAPRGSNSQGQMTFCGNPCFLFFPGGPGTFFFLPGGPFGAARRRRHCFQKSYCASGAPGFKVPGPNYFLRKSVFFFTPWWFRFVLFFLPGGPFGAARRRRHSFNNLTAPRVPRGSRFRVRPALSFQA
jgi:hypothetical protein